MAINKWRTEPIGGRIHPLLQGCVWDESSCAPEGQDFESCVQASHASWLMDSAVFRQDFPEGNRERALAAARSLGYEFHVPAAELEVGADAVKVRVSVRNLGVAPFYYDWPAELGIMDSQDNLAGTWKTDWKLTSIMPGEPAAVWEAMLRPEVGQGIYTFLLRVVNPLPGGKPLRFANVEQDQDKDGWLTLGSLGVGQ
jgi:hypothetical protein